MLCGYSKSISLLLLLGFSCVFWCGHYLWKREILTQWVTPMIWIVKVIGIFNEVAQWQNPFWYHQYLKGRVAAAVWCWLLYKLVKRAGRCWSVTLRGGSQYVLHTLPERAGYRLKKFNTSAAMITEFWYVKKILDTSLLGIEMFLYLFFSFTKKLSNVKCCLKT